MQIVRTYAQPWDTVGIDLIGPFPETTTGYKYFLTVTDFFSHYTVIAPLTDKSAKTVAYNLFNHVICLHSCAKKFMSDRGTEFLNPILNELCELLSIKKVYTSSYIAHKQTEVRNEFIALSTILYQCTLLSSHANGIFEYMQELREERKQYYDIGRKTTVFNVGVFIVVRRPPRSGQTGISAKWLPRWTAPFGIVKKIYDADTYLLEHVKTGKLLNPTNIDKLVKVEPWSVNQPNHQ